MEFRDYAAKETAALFSRLLASQAEASVQHLRSLRDALDAASRGIEDGGSATPEASEDVQELIRRLNTASGTAAKVAAQKVQKEAQAVLEGVQDELGRQRAENERLAGALSELQAHAETLRDQLLKETERAEAVDRDLDAAIEAHAHVDAARLEAEADVRKQTAARVTAEKDLAEIRGVLDVTVADAARLSGELDASRNEAAELNDRLTSAHAAAEQARTDAQAVLEAAHEELRGERERGERLAASLAEVQAQADILLADFAEAETQAERQRAALEEAHAQTEAVRAELAGAQGQIDALRGELSDAHAHADTLRGELADALGQIDGLRTELTDARSQADGLRGDLRRETERADAVDRDLDAAIEAHANVDAARMEAEAECRRQTTAAAAAEKDLAAVRALLDASVAQAAHLGMQLDANVAEKGTLAADLSAAQAELDAARKQREAITAQLEASRARIQTLERNQAVKEEQIRHLERSLGDANDAAEALRAESGPRSSGLASGEAFGDARALRDDVARMGSLLDTSAQAVDELAEKTTVTDLFAALVRHLAGEFSRVALFRLKANRLEGEDQIGFDDTTDVTKLVLPLSVDSLITRAASSGSFEQLMGGELADSSRAPFGGTPTVALAMPIAFQGETLAVVYADSDQPISDRGPAGHDASIGFAKLMVCTAGVLLMRLSQELKMLNELRDYAAMLLQEAEEMYGADMQAQKSDEERRSRLKDTIECARQLYAQRAALEGSAAAMLFDDRIAAVLETDADTTFGRDLAAIAGTSERHAEPRRRKAEAS
jgi:predicted  nucleic acid-binding Zn-ribbon protein